MEVEMDNVSKNECFVTKKSFSNDDDDQTLSHLSEILRKSNDRKDVQFIYEIDKTTIDRREWPSTNLELVANERRGLFALHEKLPQSKDGVIHRVANEYRRVACDLILSLKLNTPFVIDKVKSEAYSPFDDPYVVTGFCLKSLLNKVQESSDNIQFQTEIKNVIENLRLTKANPDPILRLVDVAHFVDGQLRHTIINLAMARYLSYLKPAVELFKEFKLRLPFYYHPQRLSNLEEMGYIYDYPLSCSITQVLGDAISNIALKIIHAWTLGISIQRESATAASAMNAAITNESRFFITLINDASLNSVFPKLMFVYTLRQARVIIDVNYIGGQDPTGWFIALFSLILFPEDVMSISSIKSCLIAVRSVLQNESVPILERMSIKELRKGVRISALQVNDYRSDYAGANLELPFNKDTTYRVPFGYTAQGVHKLSAQLTVLAEEIAQASLRHARGFDGIIRWMVLLICGRLKVTVMNMKRVLSVLGTGLTAEWKDATLRNDIRVSRSEILSFVSLFTDVGKFDFLKEAVSLHNISLAIMKETIRIFEYLRLKDQPGVSKTDALKLLEESIIKSSSSNKTLNMILLNLEETYGKGSLRMLANIVSGMDLPISVSELIIEDITRVVSDNHGAFGYTSYIILTKNVMSSNCPDLDMIFEAEENPFRFPPRDMRRVTYGAYQSMTQVELAANIVNGLVIDVTMGYDLLLVDDYCDSRRRYSGNPNPVLLSEGTLDLQRFCVVARLHGVTTQFFEIFFLSRPKFKVYVEPRTDFTHIAKLSEINLRQTLVNEDTIIIPHCFNVACTTKAMQ